MSDHALSLTIPVKAGRLDPTVRQQGMIDSYLRRREGKTVTIKLSRPASTRSLNQNRYYFGVVLATIASETGNDTESLHAVFKDMFLPRRFVKLGTKEIESVKTTTELSITEFSEYLLRINAFAAQELGIVMPESN